MLPVALLLDVAFGMSSSAFPLKVNYTNPKSRNPRANLQCLPDKWGCSASIPRSILTALVYIEIRCFDDVPEAQKEELSKRNDYQRAKSPRSKSECTALEDQVRVYGSYGPTYDCKKNVFALQALRTLGFSAAVYGQVAQSFLL